MSQPALIVWALSKLTDTKVLKFLLGFVLALLVGTLVFLLTIPLFLSTSIIYKLNLIEDNDIYVAAIAQVKSSYDIENDISPYIVKSIYYGLNKELSKDEQEVYSYIEENLVQCQMVEREVQVEETEVVDGIEQTVTTTKTITVKVYFFFTLTEIINMIRNSPYNFTDDDIRLIQAFYFEYEGEDVELELKGKYPMPVQNGYITCGYGNRNDPLNGNYTMHPALDIAPAHHAPVISIADGVVVSVNTTLGNPYGNNITIRHQQNGDTFYTFSAHLSKVMVSEGEQLTQGQTIGLEGGDPNKDPNPGRSTGHHLHFEIWAGDNRSTHVDPTLYIGE